MVWDKSMPQIRLRLPAVAFDETSVSDPSTVDTWNQVVKDSTENIGRIWTDKTVLTEDIQLEGGSRPSVKKARF